MDMAEDKPVLGRREARRNDRREAILAIAAASFLEHGYSATSMSAIAAMVGGSKATLWSYFPSKEALFSAVLDHATAAYRITLSSLLDASGDIEPTLRRFCISFLEKLTSPDALALHRLVYAEAGRFPEMGRIFFDRAPGMAHALLGGFLRSMMERGLLRSADPTRAAKMLISLCMSGVHQQLVMGFSTVPTAELLADDADAAMDVFLRAYRP